MNELIILALVGVGIYLLYQDYKNPEPPTDEAIRTCIQGLLAKLDGVMAKCDLDLSDEDFDAAFVRIYRAYLAGRSRVCVTLCGYEFRFTILREHTGVTFAWKFVGATGGESEPVEDDPPQEKPALRDAVVGAAKKKAREWAEGQLRKRL